MDRDSDSDTESFSGFLSEDLVVPREQKTAGTTKLDFDGLLKHELKLHEDLKEGCGGQLWPAGIVLTKYLLREKQLIFLRGKHILELGAGGGLTSLALAIALGEASESKIEITDQAQLLPLMQHNIELNDLSHNLVTASVLDWGESTAHKQPDVLLAADCVYFEPAFPLLLQTLKLLIGADTICWFCFKKRRSADVHFVRDLRKAFKVEDVMDDPDRSVWSRERLFLYKVTTKDKSLSEQTNRAENKRSRE